MSIIAYFKQHVQKTGELSELLLKSHLYKCRRLGSSSVLRKYLENIQTLPSNKRNNHDFASMCARKHQGVLHEVPLVIVGQDAGDVPVSGGQGLEYVCASVRLEGN